MEQQLKLTNEEKMKVFSLYFGQKVLKFFEKLPVNRIDPYQLMVANGTSNCVPYLELIPLENISDEHSIEVCSLIYASDKALREKIFIGAALTEWYLFSTNKWHYSVYQYLVSKSYAVPLFFSLGHWANNLTALELGIAVKKQNG